MKTKASAEDLAVKVTRRLTEMAESVCTCQPDYEHREDCPAHPYLNAVRTVELELADLEEE